MLTRNVIELIFSSALFINAMLFIPQAVKIWREKKADGVSLLTFAGFLLIQFAVVLHGVINHDRLLIVGYLLSMLTCGSVVILTLLYKKRLNNKMYSSDEIAQIRKSELERLEMLENIVAMMPGHVYWVDTNNIYLGCNDNQAKSAKLSSRHDIVGKRNKDLPWNFNAGTLPQELDRVNSEVMRSGRTIVVEEPATLSDGSKAQFLSYKVPMRNKEGQITCMVGISIDITERVKAQEREKAAIQAAIEEQARAEKEAELRSAISIFAGSIAHDLRTPLASMLIIIDLFAKFWLNFVNEHKQLIESEENDSMHIHFERLDTFPVKMRKIIHEMNSFINITLTSMQRLVSGALSYDDFTICHIESCINDALATYPFKENERALVQLAINDNFDFLGHPVLFYRVIFNLVRNSLEQIEKCKKGEIFISTSHTEKFNFMHFKDTASGASPEIIEYLFDGYKTTKKNGTGVGLAFCKLTMQSFGGDIICHSVEGEYIEFELSFPVLGQLD